MAQSQDRKTEEPTDRRLRDARDDGQIARSQDVSTAVVLSAVALAIWFSRDWIGARLQTLARLALDYPAQLTRNLVDDDPLSAALRVGLALLPLIVPIIAITLFVAIVTGIVQTRGLFAFAAIKPHAERLNPVEGLRELFSLRALIDLLKALLKILLLGATLFLVIRWSVGTLVKLPYQGTGAIAGITATLFAAFFGAALLFFVVIAGFDIWLQRVIFLRNMRMTPEEVKRERREDLGNPEVLARRRSIATEAINNPIMERTARASLVVRSANGNCAVAIIAPREAGSMPWVVNKGMNHYAGAIVAIARENTLLVIDDSQLARRIHDDVAIDGDLSAQLAEALRYQLARAGAI